MKRLGRLKDETLGEGWFVRSAVIEFNTGLGGWVQVFRVNAAVPIQQVQVGCFRYRVDYMKVAKMFFQPPKYYEKEVELHKRQPLMKMVATLSMYDRVDQDDGSSVLVPTFVHPPQRSVIDFWSYERFLDEENITRVMYDTWFVPLDEIETALLRVIGQMVCSEKSKIDFSNRMYKVLCAN